MKKLEGGICSPQGFAAGATMAEIKYTNKYDVAVVASEVDATVAGVFTTNRVQAAPVLLCKQVVAKGKARAIVVNSGNANACTGEQGMLDCQAMAEKCAAALKVGKDEVLVSSTGVIGVNLPMERIVLGINDAVKVLGHNHSHQFALAIMTTDTFAKESAVEFEIGGKKVRIGGVAKGSGMIHPNMATMLSFLTTDADINAELLQQALKEAVNISFNMITVDGDTSTNDSVILLANGKAGNEAVTADSADYYVFATALKSICTELAQMVIRDGEGATKFLEIEVGGALSIETARKAAKGIAGSSLAKAAFYGEDANWGRIICALGYSVDEFDPSLVDIYLGDMQVAKAGAGIEFSEEEGKKILAEKDIKVRVELNQGEYRAAAWGCDLSHEYVTINGSYRS